MARPKSDREKRIRKVSIYLTQSEFDQLEAATQNTDKTKFIVEAIHQKLKQKEDDEHD